MSWNQVLALHCPVFSDQGSGVSWNVKLALHCPVGSGQGYAVSWNRVPAVRLLCVLKCACLVTSASD